MKDAWAAGSISGLHVYQILAHAPRSMTSPAKAAIVGLAKLTDASEVRRVLQVAAEADNPTHLDLSLDQQRAKRSLRLSARANGMWAITGMLDEVDGAILAETLASFTRPRTPTTPPPPGPTPRRCPDRHVQGGGGQHPPRRVSAVSILVDLENLPTSDNATLVDGTPRCWILRPVVVRRGVHGDLRDQTQRHLHPLALGRKRRRASAAQWAALIARDRGCIRCGRTPRHCHAHHIIHWKDGGRTDLSNLALLLEMSQRPTPRPVHHHHGHPHHPRHHPHQRTP